MKRQRNKKKDKEIKKKDNACFMIHFNLPYIK